jgi:uncharacterized membrane protein (DUF441 family)
LQFKKLQEKNMKNMMKNKKLWIGIAVVIAVAWFMWSGQPAPEVTQ